MNAVHYPLPKVVFYILFLLVFALPIIFAIVANSQDCSDLGTQIDNYVQYARNDRLSIGTTSTLTQSEIYVGDSFNISNIILRVELEHDFVGDLVISITSPLGKKLVLHNKTLGTQGTDGLYKTYTNEDLKLYDNTEAMGTWTLSIEDNVPKSDGSLKYWSLTIYPAKETTYKIDLIAEPKYITTGEQQKSKITATVYDEFGNYVPTKTGVLFTTNLGVITGDAPPTPTALIFPDENPIETNPYILNRYDSLSAPMFVQDLMFSADIHQIEKYMYFVDYTEEDNFLPDIDLYPQGLLDNIEFPSIFLKASNIYFSAAGERIEVEAHLRWNIPAEQNIKIQFGLCSELEVLDGVYKGNYLEEVYPAALYELQAGQIDVTAPVLDYTFGGWEPNLVYRFYAYILDETGVQFISRSFVSFNFGRGNSTTDNKGEATATLRPDGRKGEATVQASALGAVKQTTVTIGSEPQISMRAEPTQILYDGIDKSKIYVTIKDKEGKAVPDGTLIVFSTDFGTVTPSSVPTLAGKVEAEFTSSDPGTSFTGTEVATLTAEAPTYGVSGKIEIILKSYSIDLYPESSTILGDGSSFTTLIATLKDYFHNAVVGREIKFKSDAGIISTYAEGEKINVTNDSGRANAILTSERGTITSNPCARYVNEEKCTQVGFIGATLFVKINPSDILADGISKADITVTLKDASTQAFTGERVDIYTIQDGPPANGILDEGDGDGVLEYGEDWEDIDGDEQLDEGEYNPFSQAPELIYRNDEQMTDIDGNVYATISSRVPGDALVIAFGSGVFQTGSLTFTEVIKFKVIAGEDLDGDGKSDFVNEDTNFNGTFDIGEDEDEDGNFDIGEDINSNGILDSNELDWDVDGIADTTEDFNGDGKFDAPSVEVGGDPIKITAGLLVNGGQTLVEDGTIIEFGTTLGDFSNLSVVTVNGMAITTLYSRYNVGDATVTAIAKRNVDQDGNPDNDLKQDITTTVNVAIIAGKVSKILLSLSPDNVRIGKNQTELTAWCLDESDNPVTNAVVSFKIVDGPGGGEYINPGTSRTNYTGIAKSSLFTGDIASSKDGVKIQASVIQDKSVVKSNIEDLTISGLAYEIAVGEEFSIVDPGEGEFQVFVTALVKDVNGNPVADGSRVNFSEEAILFDEDRNNSCTDVNSEPDSEDYNKDGRLNINEDLNGNGKFDRIQDPASGLYDEDLDGDGHFDVGEDILRINYTLDLDEDGNKNGILDLNEVDAGDDLDNDGKLDDINEDEALPGTPYFKNGVFDDIDIDGDGFRDEDLDKDRHFDTGEDILRINRRLDPGEDQNNNGKLDLNEDVNGNFDRDPGEDFDGDYHLDVGEDGINNFKVDGILNTEDVNGDGGILNVRAEWNKEKAECYIVTCGTGASFASTEDKNGNGILDYGEDINGNGMLDPENGAVIDSFGYTQDGKCTVTLTYLKKLALNIVVRLTAEADGIKNQRDYPLPKIEGGKEYCEPYGWSY
ncbi:proprotein convertase P-domain-containing protein [bacterium]|nr:proprotein convertase P-domain-containing protein [bacterium]